MIVTIIIGLSSSAAAGISVAITVPVTAIISIIVTIIIMYLVFMVNTINSPILLLDHQKNIVIMQQH